MNIIIIYYYILSTIYIRSVNNARESNLRKYKNICKIDDGRWRPIKCAPKRKGLCLRAISWISGDSAAGGGGRHGGGERGAGGGQETPPVPMAESDGDGALLPTPLPSLLFLPRGPQLRLPNPLRRSRRSPLPSGTFPRFRFNFLPGFFHVLIFVGVDLVSLSRSCDLIVVILFLFVLLGFGSAGDSGDSCVLGAGGSKGLMPWDSLLGFLFENFDLLWVSCSLNTNLTLMK